MYSVFDDFNIFSRWQFDSAVTHWILWRQRLRLSLRCKIFMKGHFLWKAGRSNQTVEQTPHETSAHMMRDWEQILSMGVILGRNGWAFTPSPEASCLRKDVVLNKATLWGWNKSWRRCPLQILQVGSTIFLQGSSSQLHVDYSYVWQFSLVLPNLLSLLSSTLSLFPLFPHLFAMKWWDWMPWSSFLNAEF